MGKRILIVDDSSIMRKMIRDFLGPTEHEIVGEAKNGKDAVELYQSIKPDIVTMDVTMRHMDGFTAAKEIRSFDSRAKIIFLSNLDKEKYGVQAESAGAIGFVNKHKIEELLKLI
jgi:two-component system chemotaxis response regulator CheY